MSKTTKIGEKQQMKNGEKRPPKKHTKQVIFNTTHVQNKG